MTRALLTAVMTLVLGPALSGCSEVARASPLFAGKKLGLAERARDDASLIFGTVQLDSGTLELDELALVRVVPLPEQQLLISNARAFRLLSPRLLRHGTFLVPDVPNGVYQLAWLRDGLRTWYAPRAGEVMRVEVTGPGIYDAGSYVIRAGRFDEEERPDQPSRYGDLVEAAEGTGWDEPAQRLRDRVMRER